MEKQRFFATLHFARGIKYTRTELDLGRTMIRLFRYAYTLGWQDKTKCITLSP